MKILHVATGPFIRNFDAENYLEVFLVSGIAAVLLIRFVLNVTGYPSIGDSTLHIAHMLYGGFFMVAAIFILLAFLGKPAVRFASVVGGIGFGTFIDEIGKFLTRDNNYFFQPSIALIYIIFIIIYLLIHYLDKYKVVNEKEYLVNALEITKEIVLNDLDEEEKNKLQVYLTNSDKNDRLVMLLTDFASDFRMIQNPKPGFYSRFVKQLSNLYFFLIRKKWFSKIILAGFIFYNTFQLISLPVISFLVKNREITFVGNLQLYFSFLSGVLVLIGVTRFKKSRLFTFKMFKNANLISIFFTQFFAFYQSQLSAIRGLLVNLIIWLVINYMIDREETSLADKKSYIK